MIHEADPGARNCFAGSSVSCTGSKSRGSLEFSRWERAQEIREGPSDLVTCKQRSGWSEKATSMSEAVLVQGQQTVSTKVLRHKCT